MIKYVESHAAKCGIPPQISDQLKLGHKNTESMKTKVCAVAQQLQTARTGRSEPERSSGFVFGGDSGGDANQAQRRQHIRHPRRQRAQAHCARPIASPSTRCTLANRSKRESLVWDPNRWPRGIAAAKRRAIQPCWSPSVSCDLEAEITQLESEAEQLKREIAELTGTSDIPIA